MRVHAILLFLGLAGCPAPEAPVSTPAPVATPATPGKAEWIENVAGLPQVKKVLAPSPLQLEAEVRAAGITVSMAPFVPSTVDPAVGGPDLDRAALHTGALFAHTLLGGPEAPKEQFLAQLRGLRTGMGVIGAKPEVLAMLDRSIEQVQNDTAARADFLAELDAQLQASMPGEGFGPGDTTGPLVQAGAWLAGIHVVAQTVERSGDAAAAEKLLKHPEVAGFFLEYLRAGGGAEKAGSRTSVVADGLVRLRDLTRREPLGIDEAKQIAALTGELLSQF